MLIPRCCKGCSNRKQGICNCTLPYYCNEWVEDNEDYYPSYQLKGVTFTPPNIPKVETTDDKLDKIANKLDKLLELEEKRIEKGK